METNIDDLTLLLERFAYVQAKLVEVEAMKAMNQHRDNCGEAQAYGEESFFYIADDIRKSVGIQ